VELANPKRSVMTAFIRPTPKSQYTLYDMIDAKRENAIAEFEMLTGGDQVISMVKYNVMDNKGNVTTKSMPGQTSYEPIVLLRPMDIVAREIYHRFADAVSGKIKGVKRNYSVSMNDSKGRPLAIWHLYNAMPIKISGFNFNMTTEAAYKDFEVTFQAESIEFDWEHPRK